MNGRLEVLTQLNPLLARIALHRFPVVGAHIRESTCLIQWLAVVGGFNESLEAQSICFMDAPFYELSGGSTATVLRVDKKHCEDYLKVSLSLPTYFAFAYDSSILEETIDLKETERKSERENEFLRK